MVAVSNYKKDLLIGPMNNIYRGTDLNDHQMYKELLKILKMNYLIFLDYSCKLEFLSDFSKAVFWLYMKDDKESNR